MTTAPLDPPKRPATGTESLVGAAEELVEKALVFMRPYLDITWRDGTDDPRKMAAAFCVNRQVDGIKAAITLARTGLGHVSAPFIRPACEDFFWLSYLEMLDAQIAKRLVLAMAVRDGARDVIAQQQYSGKKAMTRLGFPAKFVKYSFERKMRSEAALKELSKVLGWPNAEDSALPPTAWVAAQTGNSRLYDFLYSATSRAVHFSVGEAARRAWSHPQGGDLQNSAMDFNSVNHLNYRTDFSLYWCCHLLVLALPTAISCLEADIDGTDTKLLEEYTEAIKKLAEHGSVPVTLPSEFNLHLKVAAQTTSPKKSRQMNQNES
ncbi:DUF5677 domain-containing protein [Nonomuraea sp. NPDC048882]|uniref:DUF5677 domain-containing protein n=1 Tax=Nonomuraea sp. NPDC048882 TaxID=3154347 RepID=UPI0033C24DC6